MSKSQSVKSNFGMSLTLLNAFYYFKSFPVTDGSINEPMNQRDFFFILQLPRGHCIIVEDKYYVDILPGHDCDKNEVL